MPNPVWSRWLLIAGCACVAAAQTLNSTAPLTEADDSPRESPPESWLASVWDLPVVRFFNWSMPRLDLRLPDPPPPPCFVEPLPEIDDHDALAFEANVGTSAVVNVEGLTPGMTAALDRFVRLVTAVGGTMELKSAYRPQSYQEHLQAVWDKQRELRNNRDPGCAGMKVDVAAEFARHRLIERQRPVATSDHTLGNAFDATVDLPRRAMLRRRRVTLDGLARMAGVLRPAIATDPVHYRLIGAPSARLLAARQVKTDVQTW